MLYFKVNWIHHSVSCKTVLLFFYTEMLHFVKEKDARTHRINKSAFFVCLCWVSVSQVVLGSTEGLLWLGFVTAIIPQVWFFTPGENTQTWLTKGRDLCIPTVNSVRYILIGVVDKYFCAHHLSLWSRGSKKCKFLLIFLFACIACQSLDVQSIFSCYPIFLPNN